MSIWKLEWLRLLRTKRLAALIGVYAFFGFTAGPMARYMGEILERFGGGLKVELPIPRPADGLGGYVSNVSQLGLLVFVTVVAGAVAIDAHRDMSIFLRTRTRSLAAVILPKYVVTVSAGICAFTIGLAGAWYGSAILLGPIDSLAIVEGCLLVGIYLAFVGAIATAASAVVKSMPATVGVTLGAALLLSIAGALGSAGRWSPSTLVGAPSGLVAGAGIGDFWRAALVALVGSPLLLVLALRRGARREL